MKNNFKKITASFLTILITFLSSTASNVVSAKIVNLTVKPTTQEYQMKNLNTDICKTINKYRKNQNAKSLKIKTDLRKMAKVRAKECAKKYSHERPNGKSLVDLACKIDAGEYSMYGEVLSKAYYDPYLKMANMTLYAWKKSPAHRRVILGRKYRYIGTSYYIKDGIIYVCSIVAY